MTRPYFRYVLRALTSIDQDMTTAPIAYRGESFDAMHDTVRLVGYRWKSVPDMLFGGYYVNDAGDCLMPDMVPIHRPGT